MENTTDNEPYYQRSKSLIKANSDKNIMLIIAAGTHSQRFKSLLGIGRCTTVMPGTLREEKHKFGAITEKTPFFVTCSVPL